MDTSDQLTPVEPEADPDDVPTCDTTAAEVMNIVAEVLDRPRSDFALHTRAADIEGWDSFGHVRIVLAIDKAFGIRLSMEAIEKADGIAGLVDAVEEARGGG